jgi:hypothetical protein
MDAYVVTAQVWGESWTVEASTVELLGKALYRRCPWWTESSAEMVAEMLGKGQVVLVPEAEAVFLLGRFDIWPVALADTPGYCPPWAQPQDAW